MDRGEAMSSGTWNDAEAMDVLRGVAAKQAEARAAILAAAPDCDNCGGVGWHTESTVEVHGCLMACGGTCPLCDGTGKDVRA
jgi:hypothetical protein